MKFGCGLPLTPASDLVQLRDFVQALDGAGVDYLTTAGHVLGVPRERYDDRPPATYTGPFHDPFVLFGYLAGITQRLRFRPSILILPALPTALVAKQAAELQQLSDGRFELGVGISWNQAEYAALGQTFGDRGRRLEEQLEVLRRLWSEPYVTFVGRWHTLDGVGLSRLPPAPIPIWMGGGAADRVLQRIARLADGWIPLGDPLPALPRLRQLLADYQRPVETFGLTARLTLAPGGPGAWLEAARAMQAQGVTHLTLSPPPTAAPEAGLEQVLEARLTLAAELNESTA
jgi:probable F420-dependent oxidoreductase